MIWIELVCDGCATYFDGEHYRKDSVKRLKTDAELCGWETIKGKLYCPKCSAVIKKGE